MVNLDRQLELDRCPQCGVNQPSLNEQVQFQTKDHRNANARMWKVYVCARCGGAVMAAAADHGQPVSEMFPPLRAVDEAVPATARTYLQQAIESLHAPAGAVMLAASAVDAMLKAKDYKDGSLYNRIDNAVADRLITDDMGKWAHEVRLDANEQRHADEEATLPDQDDARKAVDFTLALGQFLFVLPSRVQRGLEESQSNTS